MGGFEKPQVVGYSSQIPYIAEGTIKSNILYGQPMHDDRFNDVISACGLVPDLEVLPGGVEVPIGCRGILLSGGQRSRVSMARAAYCPLSNAVLLDDPFGSVDSCTAELIAEQLICDHFLANHTRVVATQADSALVPRCDFVVLMHEGSIIAMGPPDVVIDSPEYRKLLRSLEAEQQLDGTLQCIEDAGNSEDTSRRVTAARAKVLHDQSKSKQLRDEEYEGRPSWSTVSFFISMGWWRNYDPSGANSYDGRTCVHRGVRSASVFDCGGASIRYAYNDLGCSDHHGSPY